MAKLINIFLKTMFSFTGDKKIDLEGLEKHLS